MLVNTLIRELTRKARSFAAASLAALVLLVFAGPAASMQKMADCELDEITAAGFSSFTMEDDVAQVWLDVNAKTYAEIDTFLANGQDGGWDQEWRDFSMGTPEDLLKFEGFVMEARFQDLSSDTDRQLLSLKMGFEKVTGTMEGHFNSFTGTTGDGTFYRNRNDEGPERYEFTGEGSHFFIIFDTQGHDGQTPGVYMDFGNARRN